MHDIFEQARDKISPNLIHTLFNSSGSYSKNGEYYILSPLRPDRNVGSFRINEETGLYIDESTGEGGDLIDLVSKSKGISLKDAADDIIKESGGVFIEQSETSNKKKKEEKGSVKPVLPIPDNDEMKKSISDRVQENWCIDSFGDPSNITRYFNEDNEWQFCVVRFIKKSKVKNQKDSKNDILFYYGIDNRWYCKHHEDLKPFPPLGIQNIKNNNNPILIVEGEKCARVDVPGFNVVSWIGGSNGVSKTNWSLLKTSSRGREIIIWPDADSLLDKNKEYFLPHEMQAGMKAAYYIKSQLTTLKILEIYRAKPIEEDPHGWDIADFIEENGDPLQFIEDYLPYNSIAVDIDSYQIYKKFIDIFYDFDSLDQIEGWYWYYDKSKHFWRKIKKVDLHCNFQRWLEETGLQWIISKKTKVTSFVNEVKQYFDRHSLNYASDNPFKNSSISPYIHFLNGAIKISKNGTEWLSRKKCGEDYFKKLYPIFCLDFDLDYKRYKKVDAKTDCPAFYHFVKDLVPNDYIEKVDNDKIEEIINETIVYVSQIIAYTLSSEKPNEYIFGIFGPQRTGKTFFIDIIRSIIGDEFCTITPVTNMENRFAAAQLWDKKVYVEPDLKTRHQLPEDFIKAYSGKTSITIEAKNKDPVSGVKISLAMYFLSNYEFQVKGIEGVERRMIMLPFKNEIKNHDTRLLDKITGEFPHGKESGDKKNETFDERPAIISIALQGWDKFCKNDHSITVPEWVQEIKNQWVVDSNSVFSFIEEKYGHETYSIQVTRNDFYSDYKEWCKDSGKSAFGKNNFYKEARKDRHVRELKSGGVDNFIIDFSQNDDNIPF